jgi:hypothetical protein
MGVRVICLLVILLAVSSKTITAQDLPSKQISAHFENIELRDVFQQLENSYGIPFYFKNQWMPDTLVTITFDQTALALALKNLLENTHLSFAIYHNQAVIIAPSSLLSKDFSEEYFINKDKQQNYMKEDNLPANLEIVNLGKNETVSTTGQFTIAGNLIDGLDGETLAGASILVKDLDMAHTTDPNGRFLLHLPRGLHVCEIRMVGYDIKTIGINVLNSSTWNIELLPEATELDEILVTGTADDSNVKSSIIGLTKLSPVELREMPVFMGEPDVIKSILTLPGISTVGEGASGFNVRGGNIDQNLIMQDNALIFNSSHAMGFFSVFNPDAIKEVTLYKGHIPAQYGGRVSSVLDVKLKGNNYEALKANGGIGLLASRLTVETPLVKDKTSLLIGGRLAYSDWVLNFVNNPDVKSSSMGFYDFNTKLSQRIGEKGTIALSYYRSHDKFEYSSDFGFSWDTDALSLTWDQVINPELISELSFSYSGSRNTSFQPSGIDGYVLGNGISNYKLKEDLLFTRLKNHTINAGFELNGYIPADETFNPYNGSSTVNPVTNTKDRGIESAIYFNDSYEITPGLSVSLGLRYSFYQQLGPSNVYQYENGIPTNKEAVIDSLLYDDWENVISFDGLDPRVSLRLTVTPSSSIKMSFNRIHQYIHLISNTTAALPIDYWQVSNTYFKPLKSNNYSLGFFKNFQLNQWETSLEAYYRDIENIIDYRDFPELFLTNHLETELLPGTGRAYGLELYIKKKSGRFNGWLSYTYSRSMVRIQGENVGENVNNGDWFPSKFDQRHNLSLVGNFNFNKTNQLSFNFTYVTGRPLTAPDANYALDDYIVPNYSERNKYRLPDNHRLDVSYTIQRGIFRTYRYKDSFTFSIYNLYARKNAYSIYFKRDRRNTFGAYKLSILGTMLPSVTYNFQF